MDLQELIDMADYICENLPANQAGEFASVLFDRIELNYSTQDVQTIASQITAEGVEVDGICKKKHPT